MTKPERPPCKRYMQAFELVDVEGRPYAEAAQQLGITVKSVRTVVWRVRKYAERHGAKLVLVDQNVLRWIAHREIWVARLNHQWREAMSAWYRSMQPEQFEKKEFTIDETGKERKYTGGFQTLKARTGDIKFLQQAMRALEKLRDLRIGTSPEPEEELIHVEHLTLEQRRVELRELIALYGPGGSAAPPGGADRRRDASEEDPGALRAA